jgi:hypothetical protein
MCYTHMGLSHGFGLLLECFEVLGDCVSTECIPVLGIIFGIVSLHCLGMNISLFLEKPHAT